MKRLLSRKWTLASAVGVSTVLLIGALLLTGMLPGATRPAHAAATGSGSCNPGTQHSVCTANGVQAYTAFYSNTDCLSTEVGVSAFQNLSQSAADPSAGTSGVFVTFYQYDYCSFTEVANAEGQVTGVDFQADHQLNTATLNATVPLTGTGVPDGYTLTLALTWHGIGDTRTNTDDFTTRSSSGIIITRQAMTIRSAIAMGTATDGTTNFVSGAALYAALLDGQGEQIIINHP